MTDIEVRLYTSSTTTCKICGLNKGRKWEEDFIRILVKDNTGVTEFLRFFGEDICDRDVVLPELFASTALCKPCFFSAFTYTRKVGLDAIVHRKLYNKKAPF